MKIPNFIRKTLLSWANKRMQSPPDVVIGGEDRPYLKRWHIIPRNRWFNIYLHRFLRSDDDRALHDHPWWNASVLLDGDYFEWVPFKLDVWGNRCIPNLRQEGFVYLRSAKSAHRIQLMRCDTNERGKTENVPVTTIFITGPRVRQWGFHCPQGWVHWEKFTADTDPKTGLGRGCE